MWTTLWTAAQLSCEQPKDAKVQKAIAAVRQAYVNYTGETERASRLQMKLRADAERFAKDAENVCPQRFIRDPEDQLVG